jgi:hypothetical protein
MYARGIGDFNSPYSELPALRKEINQARMMAYGAATWGFIRIHYDADHKRDLIEQTVAPAWLGQAALRPNTDRISRIPDRADDGQRGEPAGAGVFSGGVLNVDGQKAELPFYFDVVTVALEPRHGQDSDHGPVGPQTGQAHRRGYVQIRWESPAGLPGGAREQLQFVVQAGERNALLDQVGRALKGLGWFSGNHRHTVDLSSAGGLYAVQPGNRPGRSQEPASTLS